MLVTAAHGDRLTPACASGICGIFGDINTTQGASTPPPASPWPRGLGPSCLGKLKKGSEPP